jgi:hypothetical protein
MPPRLDHARKRATTRPSSLRARTCGRHGTTDSDKRTDPPMLVQVVGQPGTSRSTRRSRPATTKMLVPFVL